MNADDRAVVDAIKKDVEKIAVIVDKDEKVNRALSTSLIGRSNGDIVDEGGGRIGRLERLVTWAITGVVGILVWLLAQLASKYLR